MADNWDDFAKATPGESWDDFAPAKAEKSSPLEGMSTGQKFLAGAGLGMTKVGRNLWDVAAKYGPLRVAHEVASLGSSLPGVGGLNAKVAEATAPHSSAEWAEWNRLNAPLLEDTWTGKPQAAPVPPQKTGNELADASNLAAYLKLQRTLKDKPSGPGSAGETVGEFAATAPVAAVAGAPARALVGPGASLLPRAAASGLAGALEGGTVGGLTANSPEERAGKAAGGALFGGVTGTAIPAVGAALQKPRQATSEALRNYAEEAAVRSMNADRTATKRVFGRPMNEQARSDVGSYLLDEGIPLRSPAAAQEALGAAKRMEGPEMQAALDTASKAGAKVDLAAVKAKVLSVPDIAELQSNTETRPIYDRIVKFVDDQIDQHQGQMDPVAAHKLRRTIDTKLAKWNQTASQADQTAAGAFRDVRGALDDELDKAVSSAGVGDQWTAANESYKQAARAKELADVGAERRAGNRFISPSEKAASLAGAVGGLGAAAVSHNPAMALAGVAIPAAQAALNRGFFPVTARAANALSRAVAPAARNTLPAVSSESQLASLIAALRSRGIGFAPAAADEENR